MSLKAAGRLVRLARESRSISRDAFVGLLYRNFQITISTDQLKYFESGVKHAPSWMYQAASLLDIEKEKIEKLWLT